MAASANIYGNAFLQMAEKNVSLTGDTLKMALLGSGYTPDLATDTHWADIDSHEITGTGYTAGGVTLSDVSSTLTAANSWGTTWATGTWTYGQIIRPPTGNNFLYRCVTPGTSSGSAPSFPTIVGETVTDSGGVVWACLGDAVWIFTSSTVAWIDATFSASYAAIYDAETGSASTEPLLALQTFSSAQSPSSQDFAVVPDPVLGWWAVSPPS